MVKSKETVMEIVHRSLIAILETPLWMWRYVPSPNRLPTALLSGGFSSVRFNWHKETGTCRLLGLLSGAFACAWRRVIRRAGYGFWRERVVLASWTSATRSWARSGVWSWTRSRAWSWSWSGLYAAWPWWSGSGDWRTFTFESFGNGAQSVKDFLWKRRGRATWTLGPFLSLFSTLG